MALALKKGVSGVRKGESAREGRGGTEGRVYSCVWWCEDEGGEVTDSLSNSVSVENTIRIRRGLVMAAVVQREKKKHTFRCVRS